MRQLRPSLTVQWHITTSCGNHCKHCYMYDEATYEHERDHTLSYPDLVRVLDRFTEFEEKRGVRIKYFSISGGDPLLRKEWRDLVAELKRRGKTVRMMGNPETLTEEALSDLAELGVEVFQLSLDGLEKTHDGIRAPGSFRRTVAGLERLRRHGIRPAVMFTLYPENAAELIPLMRFVAEETAAARVSFDLGCYVGEGARLARNLTSARVREIFSLFLAEKERLLRSGSRLTITEKPKLLHLARFEEGSFYPLGLDRAPTLTGCLAGWTSIGVLSDGLALACRRLPLPVGKLPEQSLEEIFLGSELMRRFRRPESYAECGGCDFYQYCRGCPANVYGLTGDPFAPDPFCFRSALERRTPEAERIPPGPPLSWSNDEEFEFWASRFVAIDGEDARAAADDPGLRRLFVLLAYNAEARRAFLFSPDSYLASRGLTLDDERRFFLVSHFASREPADGRAKKFEEYILSRFLESD